MGTPERMTTALLFERDQVDEIPDWTQEIQHLNTKSILWVDLDRADRAELDEAIVSLGLSRWSTELLRDGRDRPYFGDFGHYLHVTAFVPTPGKTKAECVKVDCLVSEHWLLTVHDASIEAFDEFRERVAGSSGDVGRLGGVEFLADLLAWVLEAYLQEFEAVELRLEEFDERVMRGRQDEADDELARLVEIRQRIGRLRRALVSHRAVFLALAQPELDAITSSDHAKRFRLLRGQLEDVVQAARDSRDAVFGSFDVLIARTEHRTNEIMKVLTLGALLFLPGALIAGVLGMNFKVGFFATGLYFWVVCAGIVALGAATLGFARARDWI
jgi:magnesium transporter